MAFFTAHHTDKGIKKNTNQDALLIKTARTSKGDVGLFAVCDGMGGLSHGELASATVIKGMSEWFDTKLPNILFSTNIEEQIPTALIEVTNELNEKITRYGEHSNIKLGTTITALLIVDCQYYLLHIGDSRAYKVTKELQLLTKDQTLVAREVARGNITEEQAARDPRRNVLLQCIGATKELEINIITEKLETDAVYMLCSDGFHHRLSTDELLSHLHPKQYDDEHAMKRTAIELIELAKERKETDNISVLIIKTLVG